MKRAEAPRESRGINNSINLLSTGDEETSNRETTNKRQRNPPGRNQAKALKPKKRPKIVSKPHKLVTREDKNCLENHKGGY